MASPEIIEKGVQEVLRTMGIPPSFQGIQGGAASLPIFEPFNPSKHKPKDVGLGGLSTEYLVTQDAPDGSVWVIPSIWWDQSGEPMLIEDQEQIQKLAQEYEAATGSLFPRFGERDYETADAWARQRSSTGGATNTPLVNVMMSQE
jgi:hypothetical protein